MQRLLTLMLIYSYHEVHAPYGVCTTSGELFTAQLLLLALANGYRLVHKTLYLSLFCVQHGFLKGTEIRDNIECRDFARTLHTKRHYMYFHLPFKG